MAWDEGAILAKDGGGSGTLLFPLIILPPTTTLPLRLLLVLLRVVALLVSFVLALLRDIKLSSLLPKLLLLILFLRDDSDCAVTDKSCTNECLLERCDDEEAPPDVALEDATVDEEKDAIDFCSACDDTLMLLLWPCVPLDVASVVLPL